jgi:elongation factor G
VLCKWQAINDASLSEVIQQRPVPDAYLDQTRQKRQELLETLLEVDDGIGEIVISEGRDPTPQEYRQAIRRATLDRRFSPVLMGSAYKNKGVQNLLNAVVEYLPNPTEVYVVLPLHNRPTDLVQ